MGLGSWLSSAGSQVSNMAMSQSTVPGQIGPTGSHDFSSGPISIPVANVGSSVSDAASGSGSSSIGFNMLGAGSLLSAGADIIGGLMSYHQQKKANKEAKRQFNEMLAFQKDQFYNAAQHRVADAAKAGIHPLAALGINPHGSASPTAHVQSATGLGHALQSAGGVINQFFENRLKDAQLSLLDSQIATNKALAIKYAADANRATADTDYTRKEIANYHIYRGINTAVNAIGAGARLLKPASVIRPTTHYNYNSNPVFQRIY